jgi:putative hemolysin
MTSHTTGRFRKALAQLPKEVRDQARIAYRLFCQNPHHRGLHFRKVHAKLPIYSARVGRHHRAVGVRDGDTIIWFWIGSHAEYDVILAQF